MRKAPNVSGYNARRKRVVILQPEMFRCAPDGAYYVVCWTKSYLWRGELLATLERLKSERKRVFGGWRVREFPALPALLVGVIYTTVFVWGVL